MRKIIELKVDECEEDSTEDGREYLWISFSFVLDDGSIYSDAYIRLYFDAFSPKDLGRWFDEEIEFDSVDDELTQEDVNTITEEHIQKFYKQFEIHLFNYFFQELCDVKLKIKNYFGLNLKDFVKKAKVINM